MSALLCPDSLALHTLIHYYARKKLYHSVQTAATQALQKRANDPVLLFWKAFGTWKEGKTQDAIKDFQSIRGKQGVQLPVLLCLKQAHEEARSIDREAVQEIKEDIFNEEKNNREGSFFVAACVSMLLNEHKKAREYIGRVLEIMSTYPQAKSLQGWIELTSGSDTKARKALEIFEAASEANNKDVDAYLGKVAYLEHYNKPKEALELLNKILVAYGWFTPALAEKARILLSLGDWEQAHEAASRALSLDANSIDAMVLDVVHLLAKQSKHAAARDRITELTDILKELEPFNAALFHELAALFSRIAARNGPILVLCQELAKKATELDPTSSEYMTELGNVRMLMGQHDKAHQTFQEATKLDEANMTALYAVIRCQIMLGQVDDAAGQFEFLNEIHSGSTASAELSYIGAMLAAEKEKDPEKAIAKLEETVRLHLEACDLTAITRASISKLNPDFLLRIAKQLLEHAGSEPVPPGEPPTPQVAKGVKVLEPLARMAPGMLEAQLLLARSRFLSRDFEGAQVALSEAIGMDPSHAESHVLMAHIYIEMQRFRDAAASLEQALSHKFEIRESGGYFLLRAIVHEKQEEWPDALKVLESAMRLPGVKSAGGSFKGAAPPSTHERAAIFLHLAKVHAQLGHIPEAAKIIQDAKSEFSGTTQHANILMMDAELALGRGDVHKALVLLKGVASDSPYYVKAKMMVAQIQLTHRNNKKLYIKCFEELVDRNDSVATRSMLAEAYMKLQDADLAVQEYRKAHKMEMAAGTAGGSELAVRLGQALVSTHDFKEAIDYYEQAVQEQPTKLPLRLSLAELYMKLTQAQDAIRTLKATHEVLGDAETAENLQTKVKLLQLEARVHRQAGASDEYARALLEARGVQAKVLGRLRGEGPEMLQQHKSLAARLCSELARHSEQHKNYAEALRYYGEALKHDEKHAEAMASLARLHMDREELEDARKQCQALLKNDLETEKATMMLADIMFRSNEFDEAIRYFAQMLEQRPTNYPALEQLILLVRRAGRLNEEPKGGRLAEAPRFLRLAERSSARAALDAGFHYCKGLYARYTRNLHEALAELNQARKDGEWGRKAIRHMIEIYLDPDSLTDELRTGALEVPEGVQMARQLRGELAGEGGVQVAVYEAYELLMTQHKASVEQSLDKFGEILNADKDSVAALLGMSYALRLLKQDPKARNHLKRISKMQYNSEEAEELERSYLLLADMYIQSNKNDLAQELCRKCLTHNKSCAKAWEYQGLIYEKEASYADAAQVYEMAWQFDSQRNPAVGYKLAFNYLKAKRYVDAINICHVVLKMSPDFQKMHTDILAKARAAIKP